MVMIYEDNTVHLIHFNKLVWSVETNLVAVETFDHESVNFDVELNSELYFLQTFHLL